MTENPKDITQTIPELPEKKPMNHYILVNEDGNEKGRFSGHNPRQAALKAANRSSGTKAKPVTIKLRQTGTTKLHVFEGGKETVPLPEKHSKWQDGITTINRPFIKKIGIEKIEV